MKAWSVIAAAAALGIAGCQQLGGVNAGAPAMRTIKAFDISFDLARGQRTRPCDEETPKCLVLVDPEESWVSELGFIQVHEGPLEAIAAEEAGFVRNADGKLMTSYGRFMPVEVESFQVDGKPGLRAIVTCGTSDPETGFHAGAGDCLWAVVSDGEYSVVISSTGFGNGLEAAEAAVASLRFLPTE